MWKLIALLLYKTAWIYIFLMLAAWEAMLLIGAAHSYDPRYPALSFVLIFFPLAFAYTLLGMLSAAVGVGLRQGKIWADFDSWDKVK